MVQLGKIFARSNLLIQIVAVDTDAVNVSFYLRNACTKLLQCLMKILPIIGACSLLAILSFLFSVSAQANDQSSNVRCVENAVVETLSTLSGEQPEVPERTGENLPTWRRLLRSHLGFDKIYSGEELDEVEQIYFNRAEGEGARLVAQLIELAYGTNVSNANISDATGIILALNYRHDNRTEIVREILTLATIARDNGYLNRDLLIQVMRTLDLVSWRGIDNVILNLINQFPAWFREQANRTAALSLQRKKELFLRELLASDHMGTLERLSANLRLRTIHSQFRRLVHRSRREISIHESQLDDQRSRAQIITGATPDQAMDNAEFLNPNQFSHNEITLIESLENRSASAASSPDGFKEFGVWSIVLRTGERINIYCDNGSFRQIDAFQILRRQLGRRVRHFEQIRTIQFFHTHPPGDPRLSLGDLRAVDRAFSKQDRFHGAIAEVLGSHAPRVIDFHIYAISSHLGKRTIHHLGFDLNFGTH